MNKHDNQLTKPLFELGRGYDVAKTFKDLLTIGRCAFCLINIESQLQKKDPTYQLTLF